MKTLFCKKLIALTLACIFIFCFVSCKSEDAEDKYLVTAERFVDALTRMDFDSAYDCFWEYAGRVAKDDYIGECNYIVNALNVSGIESSNLAINRSDKNITANYDLLLHSEYVLCGTDGLDGIHWPHNSGITLQDIHFLFNGRITD